MAKPKTEDLVKGKGPEAVRGKSVEVHYSGWLENGTQFDSSVGGGPPAQGYFDEMRSTSNTSVALGGMTPPAPRAP